MNKLLTGWSVDADENDVLLPVTMGALWKLYHCDKKELSDFITSGIYGVCEKNDPVHYNDVNNLVRNKLLNLHDLSQWELVYLVLELENSGNSDRKKYPQSLWNLIPDSRIISAN